MIYFVVYLLVMPVVFGAAEAIDKGDNVGIAVFWPISVPLISLVALGYKIGGVLK